MNENVLLLLIFSVLYLLECLAWCGRDTVVFVPRWGRWKASLPSGLLGSVRAGLALHELLPPLASALPCPGWPLSLSPDGLLSWVRTAPLPPAPRPVQDALFLSWPEVRTVEAHERTLLLNGAPFCRAGTAAMARLLAETVQRLAALPPAQRGPAIERLVTGMFDRAALERRLAQHERQARWLRRVAVVLFGYLFLAVPAAVRWAGWPPVLYPALGLLVVLIAVCCLLFARAHRRLRPGEHGELVQTLLVMLLLPPRAMRAHDLLFQGSLAGFHPLAAAAVLLDRRRWTDLARRTLCDLRSPMLPRCPVDDPAVAATEAYFAELVRQAAEAFVHGQGLDPADLVLPPARSDPACRAFCPRCHEPFTITEGQCTSCGGLPLVAFTDSPLPAPPPDPLPLAARLPAAPPPAPANGPPAAPPPAAPPRTPRPSGERKARTKGRRR